MRFHQLDIGEQFEYEGEHYTKISPLQAVHTGTGEQRLIKRSALTRRLSGSVEPTHPARQEDGNLSDEAVHRAFEAFYRECEELLAQSRHAPVSRLRQRLERARAIFLETLNI